MSLHNRLNIYKFVTNNYTPLSLSLINKNSAKKELTLRLMGNDDMKAAVDLQDEVSSLITDDSLFVPLSAEEMKSALTNHLTFGLYENEGLVAFCLLMLNPDQNSDLSKDCGYEEQSGSAVLDCMFTAPECRGFGMQRFLILLSVFVAARNNKERIITTVSPDNHFSKNNFTLSGFTLTTTREKYGFKRDYFVYTIGKELKEMFVV